MGKCRDAYIAIDSLTNQLQDGDTKKVLHEYLCDVMEVVKRTEDLEKDNRYEKGFEYGYSLIKNDIEFWMEYGGDLDDATYEPEPFIESILASQEMSGITLNTPENESSIYSQAFRRIATTVMEYTIQNGHARNEQRDIDLLGDLWGFLAEIDRAL
ncbi:hypothetical protein OAN12_08725, partial [Halioglobus sp.]|nr:hypothetical protein [Halioglobus sp.]